MESARSAAVLEALDGQREPAVVRFDAGPALEGRVAVLPSAFNPPTLAHLALLELGGGPGVRPAALLSTRNVDKGVVGASLADRAGMLLALGNEAPRLAVLATNAARIADQAQALRSAFPRAEFDFVAGYDTLVRLFEPRYYTDMERDLRLFFAHHRVIAANRGEASLAAVAALLESPAARPFAGRIIARKLASWPASLSSTEARRELAGGGRPAALPRAVAAYIETNRLYRGG